MRIHLVAVLLVCPALASAQSAPAPEPAQLVLTPPRPEPPPRSLLSPDQARAARRLGTGRSFAIAGLVDLALASSLWIASAVEGQQCRARSPTCSGGWAWMPPAGLFTFSGLFALSIGIPMWAVGDREVRRSRAVALRPSATGLSVTF